MVLRRESGFDDVNLDVKHNPNEYEGVGAGESNYPPCQAHKSKECEGIRLYQAIRRCKPVCQATQTSTKESNCMKWCILHVTTSTQIKQGRRYRWKPVPQ